MYFRDQEALKKVEEGKFSLNNENDEEPSGLNNNTFSLKGDYAGVIERL